MLSFIMLVAMPMRRPDEPSGDTPSDPYMFEIMAGLLMFEIIVMIMAR